MTINKSISFSGDGLPNSPQILADNIQNLPDISSIKPDSYSIGGIVDELELKFSKIFNKEKLFVIRNYVLKNKHTKKTSNLIPNEKKKSIMKN